MSKVDELREAAIEVCDAVEMHQMYRAIARLNALLEATWNEAIEAAQRCLGDQFYTGLKRTREAGWSRAVVTHLENSQERYQTMSRVDELLEKYWTEGARSYADLVELVEAARQEGREQGALEDFESLVAAHSPLAAPTTSEPKFPGRPIVEISAEEAEELYPSEPAKCRTCGGKGTIAGWYRDYARTNKHPCPSCAGGVKP